MIGEIFVDNGRGCENGKQYWHYAVKDDELGHTFDEWRGMIYGKLMMMMMMRVRVLLRSITAVIVDVVSVVDAVVLVVVGSGGSSSRWRHLLSLAKYYLLRLIVLLTFYVNGYSNFSHNSSLMQIVILL